MSDIPKPSNKASSTPDDSQDTSTLQIIQISDIVFASSDDVKTSLKEANRKTEVWTLSERLGNIEKMIPLPKLTSSNNNYFYECVKRLIQLTDTSCVFLSSVPITKATTMWSAWWVSKLKDAAPHIKTTDQDSPRIVLTTIVSQTQANLRVNLMKIAHRFWSFQPSKNMSLSSFINEYNKRLNDLKQNFSISSDTRRQMKYLLLFHVGNLNSDLANRYRSSSFEDLLNECLQHISTNKLKKPNSNNKSTKCNYCGILGHNEVDCRKKKRAENNKSHGDNKILSVHSTSDNRSYQLDTAADYHVSSNVSDFSSYSNSNKIVFVAGGNQVKTVGHGNLIFPSIDNQTDTLHGAIHMPGQTQCILSTAQLEKTRIFHPLAIRLS